MLTKIYLSPNDEFKPVIIVWNEEAEDYIFEQIPDGLTRMELFNLLDEVEYITRMEQ